jgi:hypothetical protein
MGVFLQRLLKGGLRDEDEELRCVNVSCLSVCSASRGLTTAIELEIENVRFPWFTMRYYGLDWNAPVPRFVKLMGR